MNFKLEGKNMKNKLIRLIAALSVLALPLLGHAQVNYAVSGNTAYVASSPNASGDVVITNTYDGYPVTTIGVEAFDDCTNLTSVTIPDSVTSIGDEAFYYCYSLDRVTIPNSVTSLGNAAFEECSGLKSATIGNSVTNIGAYAFYECESLRSVTIGNSVTNIGAYAFVFCDGLTSVTIPNSVTSIGEGAFQDCSGLTSVTIPDSVTSIGQDAFAGCSGLTSVTIGNVVANIGEEAFDDCDGLTSVTIPDSVTSIGVAAFAGCLSLTNIAVNAENPYYASVGGVLFDRALDTLRGFPGGLAGSYTIPNSVTSIGVSAFVDCSGLTSVTIPNSVLSIGEDAFANCSGLTSIHCTGNAPSPTNDSTVFSASPYSDPATIYYLPGTTGWGAMFDGLPTALWFLPNPVILNNSAGFGVQPGGFGFTISWATNASVVVEAATNLANPVWLPLSTSALTNGTNYFSDPQWTNYHSRFYRVTSAFTVGGTLTGLPAGDTVTLQDNGSDNLTLSTNGTFTFPTALPNGHTYSVTVSGTSGGTSIQTEIDWPPVTANCSGTISGANVTNVAVQCTPIYTGYLDVDMYNAAVADGTANGGVPGVMLTELGGPFRVTALGNNTVNVALIYQSCQFTITVGSTSCSSTTFPSGTQVIQFGGPVECGAQSFYGY